MVEWHRMMHWCCIGMLDLEYVAASWQELHSMELEIPWRNATYRMGLWTNIVTVRDRVQALTKGCKCTTGCKQEKNGYKCSMNVSTTELTHLSEEHTCTMDEMMAYVFGCTLGPTLLWISEIGMIFSKCGQTTQNISLALLYNISRWFRDKESNCS